MEGREGGKAEVEEGEKGGSQTKISCPRPKDAVAAIRKRLTGNTKNFHIINLTLTVSCQFDTERKMSVTDSVFIHSHSRCWKPVSRIVALDSIPKLLRRTFFRT